MMMPDIALGTMLVNSNLTKESIWNFRIIISVLPIMPIIFMAMSFFPAIDKGKPAAIVGIARQLIFFVPMMLILPALFGTQSIYWGSALIDGVIIVYTMMLLLHEFKRLKFLK